MSPPTIITRDFPSEVNDTLNDLVDAFISRNDQGKKVFDENKTRRIGWAIYSTKSEVDNFVDTIRQRLQEYDDFAKNKGGPITGL